MFCRKNLGIVALVGVYGLFGSNNSFAGANNYWGNFQGKVAPSAGKQLLTPNTYQISTLDQGELLVFLSKLSEDPSQAKELSLPTPDGKEQKFLIWKTPILEAPLQAKFSEIQTYTAKAIDNGAITAKIDYTLNGFHAMIFDGDNSYVIDPYSNIADGYYLVYYKKDYTRPIEHKMVCEISDGNLPDAHGVAGTTIDGSLPKLALRQNGSNRKTYRLALSCTGEYAVAVSTGTPTTAGVLSAMVTTMNRVNGIYERELSATMVLIGNNDTLIYLSPSTDPFTANNNGGALLGQNQNNTNSKIGSANYDIGHIFSTGGGGIASLGSVCSNWGKAEGVTGSANPIGDPFDVDYVSHEMGHQFGANHTFNDCSGNENNFTAFEPGSGSTIMAYAGICGSTNNLQNSSNAYFHKASLDEISEFIVNGGFGGAGGASCGTNTAGDVPPSLPNIAASYAIPYQTPFELEAPVATIPATDTMLYCWVQWNLGNLATDENVSATFTAGPSFRSFAPVATRTRVFPRIQAVLSNVSAYKGERLPTVARVLRFKADVRSLLNGWGTFDIADNNVTLNVINTGTPFEVNFPSVAADTLFSSVQQNITWNVAQTDIAPINTPNVDILLSVDGGNTFPFTLATNVPNTGAALLSVVDTNTTTARIKIKGTNNVFFDISNANFVISDMEPTVGVSDINVATNIKVYPNPAAEQLTIKNSGSDKLTLRLYNAVGQNVWSGEVVNSVVLPVSHYARGLYYLQINNGKNGGAATQRITLN